MAEWVDLLPLAQLEPGDVTPIVFNQRPLAVYDAPDGVYVTSARCTHAGADLCDGYFDRYIIECPLHQGCFDIRSGQPKGAPVTRPLKTFTARVHQGTVQLLIEEDSL